jgi:hypothetical protein
MSLIKCPNMNNEIKEYVIPTKSWLVPIEKLMIDNDINTRGKIYVAKLLEKDKILVKITGKKRR